MVCNPAQSKCDNNTRFIYKQKKIDTVSILFAWERLTVFPGSPTANDGGEEDQRQYKHLKHTLVSPILQESIGNTKT